VNYIFGASTDKLDGVGGQAEMTEDSSDGARGDVSEGKTEVAPQMTSQDAEVRAPRSLT